MWAQWAQLAQLAQWAQLTQWAQLAQLALPVAFCNFPSCSREKEVLAGN